ncbi:hypothetical protein [Sulfitobacter sp.]|uniref:hypothetical protein n=1 Tax=Sulfitobacter sp. TaxID=1903071 RepID=UPI00260EA74F|nr:hypothetical protein [Sulfitobacter sp.]
MEYYLPLAEQTPPDGAIGLFGSDVKKWLENELEKAFPKSDDLIKNMTLSVDFKDVTYETLQDPHFIQAIKNAFPGQDWEKAHSEYRAAGEARKT